MEDDILIPLKNCPFCKSKPDMIRVGKRYSVWCKNPLCDVRLDPKNSMYEAAKVWNKRVSLIVEACSKDSKEE